MNQQKLMREIPYLKSNVVAIIGLATLVVLIYFTRVAVLPIAGEESRYATAAMEMIETGDWIVTRQQGQLFPERPPLSTWVTAVGGLIRGEVDVVAIRLPSLISILLTSLLIFWIAKDHFSVFGAFAAGAVYATFGQVMEIGRMGESEALFTLFLSASLLMWFRSYSNNNRTIAWLIGYTMMALATMVKGAQAPIYFCGPVFCFLLFRWQWSWLFSWAHLAGAGISLAIVGAWQIPYFMATDAEAVMAIWTGLVSDRISTGGLLTHMLTFPLDTMQCLLPWVPLLLCYISREFRRSIRDQKDLVQFLVVALLITYPTVLFATGARGRYFMPMYPMIAILIGLVVQKCSESAVGSIARIYWNRYVLHLAGAILVFAGLVFYTSTFQANFMEHFQQPLWYAILFALISGVVASVLIWNFKRKDLKSAQVAFTTTCLFLGLLWTTIVMSMQSSRWNHIGPAVTEAKSKLPDGVRMVSFAPIDHRFCYYYRQFIEELNWPQSMAEVPEDIEYFCIDQHGTDTTEFRSAGRGRSWTTTSGTLPFKWEEVARVPCNRRLSATPQDEVIIGRIIR